MNSEFEQDLEGLLNSKFEELKWDTTEQQVCDELSPDFSLFPELSHNGYSQDHQLINNDAPFLYRDPSTQQDLLQPDHIFSDFNPSMDNPQNDDFLSFINSLDTNVPGSVELDEQVISIAQQKLNSNSDSNSNRNSANGRGNERIGCISHGRSQSAPMVLSGNGFFADMGYDVVRGQQPLELFQSTVPDSLFQYSSEGQLCGFPVKQSLHEVNHSHRRATSDLLPQWNYSQLTSFHMQVDAQYQGSHQSMHSRSNTCTNYSDGGSQQTLLNSVISEEGGALLQEHQLVPILDAGIREYGTNAFPAFDLAPSPKVKDQNGVGDVTQSPTSVIMLCGQPHQQQQYQQQLHEQKQQKPKTSRGRRELDDMSPRSRKRVVANRESAKKSRDRKERYKIQMEQENHQLNKALKTINKDVQSTKQSIQHLKQRNLELRDKILQLEKLQQIHEIITEQQRRSYMQ
eukprot:TRINITY_DN71624_c0_g1_i1.p1 TRINITY_DN71624_c0_g1~~TRINITY_DN71624_c0_g1_i1.p1  ORF type:complete len:458 (+),score=39.17 TRINITY_DN71624_c0_g1_i1:150-1523(+)